MYSSSNLTKLFLEYSEKSWKNDFRWIGYFTSRVSEIFLQIIFIWLPCCVFSNYLPSISPQTNGPPLPGTYSLVSAPDRCWFWWRLLIWFCLNCRYSASTCIPVLLFYNKEFWGRGYVPRYDHCFVEFGELPVLILQFILLMLIVDAVALWRQAEWKLNKGSAQKKYVIIWKLFQNVASPPFVNPLIKKNVLGENMTIFGWF